MTKKKKIRKEKKKKKNKKKKKKKKKKKTLRKATLLNVHQDLVDVGEAENRVYHNSRGEREQVPRANIRCDFFIATHYFLADKINYTQ